MHVIDLFDALSFAPDVHVVPALLPRSIAGVMVHGWGQFKLLQHLLAPREDKVSAQVAQNKIGRAFRQPLHDLGRVRPSTRPDHQMTVVGHQHVTDNFEAQLRPEITQGLDEFELIAIGVKNAGSPMGVGGQVVEMVLTIEMLQAWHWHSLHAMI